MARTDLAPAWSTEFRIIKNKENPEICTIVFTAGPPYEDIAFTIVNRPWEHSHKRGFRSSFDRGVLQLHFSFRRNFYRSESLSVSLFLLVPCVGASSLTMPTVVQSKLGPMCSNFCIMSALVRIRCNRSIPCRPAVHRPALCASTLK